MKARSAAKTLRWKHPVSWCVTLRKWRESLQYSVKKIHNQLETRSGRHTQRDIARIVLFIARAPVR